MIVPKTKVSAILRPLLVFQFWISLTAIALTQNPGSTVHVKDLDDKDFFELKEQVISVQEVNGKKTIILKVFTEDGRFVSGLGDVGLGYEIFLRNTRQVQQECNDIQLVEVSESDAKSDLCFSMVLDYSGSMLGVYNIMQQAAMNFIEAMNGAAFTRVNFDHNIHLVNSVATNAPVSVYDDDFSRYGGSTALYGALVEAGNTLKEAEKNKFIVVFTDGLENASGISTNSVISYLQSLRIPVYGISFGVSPELQRLREICQYTNGGFYHIQSMDELRNKFLEISQGRFGSYYKVVSKCEREFDELVVRNGAGSESVLDLKMPLRKAPDFNDPILFRTFHFEVGEFVLTEDDQDGLEYTADKVIRYLMNNTGDSIVIVGHASPEGGEKMNWLLSYKRAFEVEQRIKNYLLEKYLNDVDILNALKRISIDFYGDSQPLYPVTSYYNRDNRRVHIIAR